MLPEDNPPYVAPTSPNVQFQPPYALFPETPAGMFLAQVPYDAPQEMIQDPYFPLQDISESTTVPPQTIIAPSDNSVRNTTLHISQTPSH